MGRFYLPTRNADDWRNLLADPKKQWRNGYSAKALATSWENADGLPAEVMASFRASGLPLFQDVQFVVGFPEYKVQIPPIARHPSQTDLLVLARSGNELVVITVEGKVEESFDKYVLDWRKSDSPGKVERLAFLTDRLDLPGHDLDGFRYQLLHRAASALLAAEQFAASRAVLLVHSFSKARTGFQDFAEFLSLFSLNATPGTVQRVGAFRDIELYASWTVGVLD